MMEALPATPTLRGEFVTLRPLEVADAAATHAWRHEDRARYLNAGAATVDDQARWIAGRPASSEHNFLIELNGGPSVGMLSLVDIDLTHRRAESARFLIGDEAAARGRPAAVEAMKLLYEHAFDGLELERVYGLIAEPNRLMLKWQLYLGMKEEGRLRRHYRMEGGFVDAMALGLLAADYRTTALPRMRALIAAGRPRAKDPAS